MRTAGSRPPNEGEPVLVSFPDRIGIWEKAAEITYEPGIIELLGTSDVLSRTYRAPDGRMLNLLVIHAVDRRDAFHPPEYCLTGGGSEIIDRANRNVAPKGEPPVAFNEMLFKTKANSRLLVWNTYAAGKELTANFYRQQAHLFSGQLFRRRTAGAAVNIYVNVSDDNPSAARETAAEFARALIPELRSRI